MDADEPTKLTIGKVLNERYKIVALVGEGTMGTVYKGERIQLGRPVAIKFLHALYHQHAEVLGRFEREAQAMSKLSHPFCVSVIDFGIDDTPYIVMDFAEGETLAEAIGMGRFKPDRAIRLTQQILAGVGHAHSQGIIHRDIKPANIRISRDQGLGETVRIFDFGLAKLLGDTLGSELSTTGMMLGTPTYISPEQACAAEVDGRADFYSVGVILFEMLCGVPPLSQNDGIEVIKSRLEEPAPSLHQVLGDVNFSPELEKVVAQALSRDPDQRFASADEFAEALAAVPEAVPPPKGAPLKEAQTKTEKPPRKRPPKNKGPRWFALAWLLAAIVLLLTAVALIFVFVVPEAKEEQRTLGARAESYAADGDLNKAIDVYTTLRRDDPNNGGHILALAGLFFKKKWWGDSLDHYEEAVRINRTHAQDEILIQNVIEMLGKPKLGKRARRFIAKKVGKAALPHLEHASVSHKSSLVRQKARQLHTQLSPKIEDPQPPPNQNPTPPNDP